MNDEQVARWREKLDSAYRCQTGSYRDELTIAAEMLAKAEDRENRMAEAVSETRPTCKRHKECARLDGHSGECMFLGNA